MPFDRVQVLAANINTPRKPKGPRDTMMTNIADFIHFISFTGGMTIKQVEAKFGVREACVLRWKRVAQEKGVEIEVTKKDGTPIYTCDSFKSKLALADACDRD